MCFCFPVKLFSVSSAFARFPVGYYRNSSIKDMSTLGETIYHSLYLPLDFAYIFLVSHVELFFTEGKLLFIF